MKLLFYVRIKREKGIKSKQQQALHFHLPLDRLKLLFQYIYLNTRTVLIECTIDGAFDLFATLGIDAFDPPVVLQHKRNIFFEVSPKERLKLN